MNTSTSNIQCQSCDYAGQALVAHHGYKWWMLPVGIALSCTGIGLIPMAVIFILLGNQTFNACPKCGSRKYILSAGPLTAENQAIWANAKDADEKAFKKNKLILLAVTMTMFAAAFVFMIVMMRNG